MERKDSNSGVENTKTFLFPFFVPLDLTLHPALS